MRRSGSVAWRTLFLLSLPALAGGGEDPPLSVRRVQIDSAGLARVLHEAQELVPVGRREFEQTLRQAQDRRGPAATSPQLQAARYEAQWHDGQLLGTAALTLRHADHRARVFPLEPWRFAVRGPARLDGQPALLGEVDGQTFGVVLEKPGIQALTFGWSAPLQRRPEGWWFFLTCPPAPITEVALDLPTNLVVELPGARHLAPSAVAISPEARRWRILLDDARSAMLEVWIRPTQDAAPAAFRIARQSTEHEIGPAALETRAEIDLEVTQGRLADVVLETDERLEVVSAALRTTGQPPLAFRTERSNGRNRVTLALPADIGKRVSLEVRGRAASPVGVDSRWRLPWLRVPVAPGARETLSVRSRSDVVLSDWEFGDYQALLPPQFERRSGMTNEVFTLEQRNLGSPGQARMPSLQARLQGPDFSVRQEAWWHVAAGSSSFVVRSSWQVQAGKLPSLVLLAPQDWQLEELELNPSGLLLDHYSDPRTPGRILVQLKGAADAASSVRLTARFGRAGPPLDLSRPVTLETPHLVAEGARWQETTLAVTLERGQTLRQPLLRASLPGGTGAGFAASLPAAPWARFVQTPDLVVNYFGARPPSPLAVEPATVRTQTRLRTCLFVGETAWRVRYEVEVSPLSGSIASIPLRLPVSAREVHWQVVSGSARMREARRIPSDDPGKASVELVLDRPVDSVVSFLGEFTVPPSPSVDVPLIAAEDDPETKGTLVIQVEPGQRARVQSEGLEPGAEVGSAAPGPPIWQAFHYESKIQSVLVYRAAAAQESPATIAAASLLIRCQPTGMQLCTYQCLVLSSRQSPLQLRLPEGAEFRALWLNGQRLSAPSEQERIVTLPAAAVAARYRIDYVIPTRMKAGLTMVDVAAPQWESAVILLSLRRFLAVPAAWAPLGWSRLERVAGAPWPDSWLVTTPQTQDLESLGRSLRELAPSAVAPSLRMPSIQFPGDAAASPFEASVDFLRQALAQSPGQSKPYVLDAVALAARRQASTVAHDGQDKLEGLVNVPCRGALLVTTASQLRAEEVSSAVAAELRYGPAVGAALAHGRDAAGRFQRLTPGLAPTAPEPFDEWDLAMGWTTYEVLNGEETLAIAVIRRDVPWLLGALVGLMTLGVAWWVRRRTAWRLSFLLCLLVGAALCWIWLPAPLKGAAVGPAAGAALGWMIARKQAKSAILSATSSHRLVVSPSALLLVVAGLFFAQGRCLHGQSADAATTVYYYTDSTGAEQVYVPRTLWRRLLDLSRDVSGPRYVLLEAAYMGRIDAAQGEFEAEYRLQALVDDPLEIDLPLRNVRLRQALLDQRPTLVEPLPQENGFRARVAGRGLHTLLLHWTTARESRGDERELRFAVPPVTSSRLQLHLDGRRWEAPDVRGATMRKEPAGSLELAADLGRVAELHVRSAPDGGTKPPLRVQAFHRWELSLAAWRLQSRFDYQVSSGRVPWLRVLLPPGLEVQDVECRAAAGDHPGQLREWQVEKQADQRFLRVVFDKPVMGRIELRLDCRVDPAATSIAAELGPLAAMVDAPGRVGLAMASLMMEAEIECLTQRARTARLVVPTPLDVQEVSGFVAVSLDEIAAVEVIPAPGLTTVAAGAEVTRLPPEFLGEDQPAAVFRYAHPAAPSLLLRLRPTLPGYQIGQSLAIHVDGGAVELRGRIDVRVTEGKLTLLRFQLPPPLTLLSLQGEDIHRWSVQDNTVQVWLRRSLADATQFTLRGWLHTTPEMKAGFRLAIPRLQFAESAAVATHIELHSRSAIRLEMLGSHGLHALTGPFADGSQLAAWQATTPAYQAELLISPAPASTAPSTPMSTSRRRPEAVVPASLWDDEHLVTLAPDARALGLTRCVLTPGASGALAFSIPEGILPLALAIDGRFAEFSWSPSEPLVATLPGGRAWCEVALLWTEAEKGTGQRSGKLCLPLADAVRACRRRLCLLSPAGVASPDVPLAGRPEDAAALELQTAEQWLRLLQGFARDTTSTARIASDSPRRDALQRIAQHLQAAEASIEQASPREAALLSARLATLRRDFERRVDRRSGEMFVGLESAADRLFDIAFTTPSVPVYGLFDKPLGILHIEVTDPGRAALEQRLRASLAVLGLGVAAWGLRRIAWAKRLTRWLAPEVCAAAGALWWILLPGWWLGALAILTGAVWRGARVARWIAQPSPPLPESLNASPVVGAGGS